MKESSSKWVSIAWLAALAGHPVRTERWGAVMEQVPLTGTLPDGTTPAAALQAVVSVGLGRHRTAPAPPRPPVRWGQTSSWHMHSTGAASTWSPPTGRRRRPPAARRAPCAVSPSPRRTPAGLGLGSPDPFGTAFARRCVMLWIWLGFILFILVMLALDLGVFHRKAHVVAMREALGWSAVWIAADVGE